MKVGIRPPHPMGLFAFKRRAGKTVSRLKIKEEKEKKECSSRKQEKTQTQNEKTIGIWPPHSPARRKGTNNLLSLRSLPKSAQQGGILACHRKYVKARKSLQISTSRGSQEPRAGPGSAPPPRRRGSAQFTNLFQTGLLLAVSHFFLFFFIARLRGRWQCFLHYLSVRLSLIKLKRLNGLTFKRIVTKYVWEPP